MKGLLRRLLGRLRGRRGADGIRVLSSMPATCRHLEGRAAALRAMGTNLSELVACVDNRDPRAVVVFVTPRADAREAALKNYVDEEAQTFLDWLAWPDGPEVLRVILVDGEEGGTLPLGELVTSVQRIEGKEHGKSL